MKLIVGLGNPGAKYSQTRHNIGFIALDAYAKTNSLKWDENKRFNAWVSQQGDGNKRLLLAKPATFMNSSGESVRKLVDFYNLKHQDILIIHDDADIEFGKLRLVQGGNDGGHKGVASLNQHGINDTWRLKVGVSNPDRTPGQAIDFVLRQFNSSEKNHLPLLMDKAINIVLDFAHNNVQAQTFNS